MEWFHFSDFHFGRPKGPQTTAMSSLLDAVKLTLQDTEKVDAVFITGDIAYSGTPEQYEKFRQDFLLPLRGIKAFANARFYAVPGNHDVDCDAALPIAWETIGDRNQEVFFSEDADGIKARRGRAVVFDSYWEFVQKNGIISPNPSREVTLLCCDESLPFDILATNTAFFSDREKDSSEETTPSPLESLRHVLVNRQVDRPIVILAHHPITCLIKNQQPPLESFLKEKKAVFLHGHEHAPQAKFGRDGTIRTLGFGASYIKSLQSQTAPPYLNTFTHCRLIGKELKVKCVSWHSNAGVWTDSTAVQLPECMPDNDLGSGQARVFFPSLVSSSGEEQGNIPLREVQRAAPKATQIIPIDPLEAEIITRLFSVSANLRSIYKKGEPRLRELSHDDGKMKFEVEQENGQRNLLIIIWAGNHVLSSKEIEAVNTEVDTEGFASATVISIGKISRDANTMYLRLKARKPIEVLVNESITAGAEYLLTVEQQIIVAGLDAAKSNVALLIGRDEIYLLIIDDESQGQRRFSIVASSGEFLLSTNPVVARLRKGDPDFAVMAYAGEEDVKEQDKRTFQETTYLSECHGQYNVMKYAALANVGLRFSDLPLEKLYVSATASEVSDKTTRRSEQIIDDHLATYPISEELKEHIQTQLLEHGERQETSRAREFCQKYSAVLVTGDPGSGKTCFVKSEILAYCKRALNAELPQEELTEEVMDWHSSHVPVMLQLSEVVAEKDLDEKGLFVIASRLLERRALFLPSDEMRRFAMKGKIAFFFDGLDEVVSIEKRALVVKHINELVIEFLPAGNRVVVTSRPAAVQVVNLLPALHRLELQGLTETEIRMLARRLLALELSATAQDVCVDEGSFNEKDNVVISQLINDCNKNPGVSRMAQNPLLLTLLIMIYANSGAPSAKRHRIYEEAIKTLASVRGREAGHQPISVQDLRERLGAMALSVYKKESGLLPLRAEVSEVVRCVMERQRGEQVNPSEANAFIQKVAESTGLIVLEARQGEEDSCAIVTFMHHSFLEYFAAIGLSRELETSDVGSLVSEARWREILTLLAGIIGESEDVSPIIKRFLDAGASEPDVDARLLLFAIDCAMECEVPSEAAQRLISSSIKECLSKGSGRQDSWVRSEIGRRLEYLLTVCGGSEFDGMVADLIKNGDETTSAAAIDVLGYACANGYESPDILSAFEYACSRTDDAVLSAVCVAGSRSRSLRTNAAEQVISSCLRKSPRNKQAAFEALANVPTLASSHWEEIINGIEDNNSRISRWASSAAIHAGLNVDVISLNATRKDILLRALNQADVMGSLGESRHPQMKKETLNKLLTSGNLQDRILGIRLLPLAEGEERYVYEMLISLVRKPGTPREELVAGLMALNWSGSVLDLFTVSDLRVIADWLVNGTSDVRIQAAQLLGWFGKDQVAVEALLSQDFGKLDIPDYCARILALSRAQVALERVKEVFFKQLATHLDNKKMTPENLQRTKTLLDASKRLEETAPYNLVQKIRSLVDDFRIDDSLKRKALLCFPAIAMPSKGTVENVTKICLNPPSGMDLELVQLPAILAKKCRKSVDYVVACVGALSELRGALLHLHVRFSKRKATEENEYCITQLRNGINDVTQIIVAFKDFIDKGASTSKQLNSK